MKESNVKITNTNHSFTHITNLYVNNIAVKLITYIGKNNRKLIENTVLPDLEKAIQKVNNSLHIIESKAKKLDKTVNLTSVTATPIDKTSNNIRFNVLLYFETNDKKEILVICKVANSDIEVKSAEYNE